MTTPKPDDHVASPPLDLAFDQERALRLSAESEVATLKARLSNSGDCQVDTYAENEKLRERDARLTAELAATRERENEWIAAATELKKELADLADALQTLYDEQNGPPLIRDAPQWQAAMDRARELLKAQAAKGER